jgi:hypothetical protein
MSDSSEHLKRSSGEPSPTARGPEGKSEDAGTTPPQRKQRRNSTLRTLVDGLLDHIRDLSGRVDSLTPEELEDAHQRFNSIAELMWAVITDEKNRPGVRSDKK